MAGNNIQLKRSSVAGRVPDAANILVGEPVVNLNDKIIFTKDGGGNVIVIGAGTTANVVESGNLYFTNTRAIAALTAGQNITIDANGRINSTVTGGGGAVDSVNGLTGTVVLSTANIAESGNLYFTNARVIDALTEGTGINIDANGLITTNITTNEVLVEKTSPTISSGTLTLDLQQSLIFEVNFTSSVTTLTINNIQPSGNASSFVLVLIADGTTRSFTWPASFKWPSGTAPTITSTNNKKDIFIFFTTDAGTSWNSLIAGQNL